MDEEAVAMMATLLPSLLSRPRPGAEGGKSQPRGVEYRALSERGFKTFNDLEGADLEILQD